MYLPVTWTCVGLHILFDSVTAYGYDNSSVVPPIEKPIYVSITILMPATGITRFHLHNRRRYKNKPRQQQTNRVPTYQRQLYLTTVRTTATSASRIAHHYGNHRASSFAHPLRSCFKFVRCISIALHHNKYSWFFIASWTWKQIEN